ncbi:acetyltransferase [Geodermatophilus sp. Leaf369]|jgi:predicted GNAT family acetyltransferase|uniref:GNAT family N-acetyltransferase n=1 Tax=Geodermatophilus sp. Leaf369 TaxID=1736354 RepID=UPI0006F2504E|nr:acetyltransferase [Geodermatophilus sp. Leaf369]
MTSSTREIRVEDAPARNRFEVSVDDQVVGLASYHVEGDVMTLPHTEVSPAVAGQGLGTTLVAAVLASARERHLTVLPYCSFVRHYLHEHPADVDLVAEADRPHFGLELTSN